MKAASGSGGMTATSSGTVEPVGRLDRIEADRRARRAFQMSFVGIDRAGRGDADDGEQRHAEDAAAAHGSILRRPIHAAWRSGV
jgi:hypothetical protein